MSTSSNFRQADYPVDPGFLNRWSPRAFDSSQISAEDLLTILEAGRWAPSAFNAQPWRFVYARRDTPAWETLFPLLNEFNQSWAKTASALIFFVSKTVSVSPSGEKKPSYSHSFDTGAAWSAIAHQAEKLGFQAHGMTGIHFDQAKEVLKISDDYRLEAAAAIGRKGDASILPEGLQARETPSPRQPLSELAFEGTFIGD
ncbi:nitroreductase [Xaviernesmea oryzae]|uniref:Nitroreductase n=1 Tax=Xaviernesmea oryzae TaxID=464029 RepID=A0A1Q9AYB5_9HYPH|nr:nitroreductase family protein [Xaviernesmea oryzae]OLP60415.1 nitroreductase [Xaviernesmea oryzae]SEK19422.1 Nitroreductase family protein [Xaviernesmea oryzae]